jgi:ribosome modulation factor
MELKLIRAAEGKPEIPAVLRASLIHVFSGARLVRGVNCLSGFDDGRSAAWAGATLASCPYSDPLLAKAWACGWRAGQAEQRARHG